MQGASTVTLQLIFTTIRVTHVYVVHMYIIKRIRVGRQRNSGLISGSGSFFSPPNVQTLSGSHPAFYSVVTWGLFIPGCEADYSLQSSAKVKNAWSYISTPSYAFVWRCLTEHRDFNHFR